MSILTSTPDIFQNQRAKNKDFFGSSGKNEKSSGNRQKKNKAKPPNRSSGARLALGVREFLGNRKGFHEGLPDRLLDRFPSLVLGQNGCSYHLQP